MILVSGVIIEADEDGDTNALKRIQGALNMRTENCCDVP